MPKFKLSLAEAAALVLAGALVSVQLMLPPMVGLANNGDFERLMHWGKFEYLPTSLQAPPQERYCGWVISEYRITENPLLAWRGFGSTEAIFIKLSAIVGSLLLADHRFD